MLAGASATKCDLPLFRIRAGSMTYLLVDERFLEIEISRLLCAVLDLQLAFFPGRGRQLPVRRSRSIQCPHGRSTSGVVVGANTAGGLLVGWITRRIGLQQLRELLCDRCRDDRSTDGRMRLRSASHESFSFILVSLPRGDIRVGIALTFDRR